MRISDWSSDVCSSDLAATAIHIFWNGDVDWIVGHEVFKLLACLGMVHDHLARKRLHFSRFGAIHGYLARLYLIHVANGGGRDVEGGRNGLILGLNAFRTLPTIIPCGL